MAPAHERIEGLSAEIGTLARAASGSEQLMRVPGIEPIFSSAMFDVFRARLAALIHSN